MIIAAAICVAALGWFPTTALAVLIVAGPAHWGADVSFGSRHNPD
jgi:hypothetical protein